METSVRGARWALSAIVAVAACGGHEDIISGGTPDGGPRVIDAAVVDVRASDARVFFDAGSNPTGPSGVSVTSPAPGSVILGGRQVIACHALPNPQTNSPVTTMVVQVVDGGGRTVSSTAASVSSSDWTATVVLDAMANGNISVSCTATAADGNASTANSIVGLDLGPRIQVAQPAAGSAVHGNINIDFFATALPVLTPTDPGAAVVSVTAVLAGKTMTLTNPSPGRYTASVRADDTTIFDTPLDGLETLRATAIDQRGAVRLVLVQFEVDNTPPTIVIDKPQAADLIGGVFTVEAHITDANGVDPNTVVAVIGNGPDTLATFALSTADGLNYTGHYDSKELRAIVEATYGTGFQLVAPTLSVRARDLPGNEGAFGEVVFMDYMPPIVSMDGPMVREGRIDVTTNLLVCSFAFNPLGLDSTIDRQTVAQLSEMRARIVDRGNTGTSTSGVVLRYAGVDDNSAQLFILDNTDPAVGVGDALLVDTDGDGICDDINPMLRPTTLPMMATDALAVNLAAVSAHGQSYFGIDGSYTGYAGCGPPSQPDAKAPPSLCILSTGLQRAVGTPLGHDPEIFGIPLIDANSCLGQPIDSVANNIHDGWACVAVRAKDKLGNVGISPPLRVCFDHDLNGSDGCPAPPTYTLSGGLDVPGGTRTVPLGNPGAIDCTGTYYRATPTTPEHTDPNLPCTLPPNFPAGEVIRIDL